MSLERKNYVIQAFQGGVYAGTLPEPVNEFFIDESLGSAGASLTIMLNETFETLDAQLVNEYLITEDGDYIVTELGDKIITGYSYDFGLPIDVGTRIEIYETDSYAPAGQATFIGEILSLEEDQKSGNIVLNLVSLGITLDNFWISSGDTPYIVQDISDNIGYAQLVSAPKLNNERIEIQEVTFTDTTPIAGASIYAITGVTTIRLSMYKRVGATPDLGTDPQIATGTTSIDVTSGAADFYCPFDSSFVPDTASTYYLTVECTVVGITVFIGINTTNPYGGGIRYVAERNFSAFGDYSYNYTAYSGHDLRFSLYKATGGYIGSYSGITPTAMLTDMLDAYRLQGGPVTYDAASIGEATNVEQYEFYYNTLLEGIRSVRNMLGDDWYWYVDCRDNKLSMKQTASTAEHIFYVGQHVERVRMKRTIEGIENTILFTGGLNGATNVVAEAQDSESRQDFGQWLGKPIDNRVTTQATANTFANSRLSQRKDARWQTEVTISAADYNISSIKLGQVVTFKNAGSIRESMLLKIVRIARYSSRVVLTLDTIMTTNIERAEHTRRLVEAQATINNPA